MPRRHKKDTSFFKLCLLAVSKCLVPQATDKVLQTVKKKKKGGQKSYTTSCLLLTAD